MEEEVELLVCETPRWLLAGVENPTRACIHIKEVSSKLLTFFILSKLFILRPRFRKGAASVWTIFIYFLFYFTASIMATFKFSRSSSDFRSTDLDAVWHLGIPDSLRPVALTHGVPSWSLLVNTLCSRAADRGELETFLIPASIKVSRLFLSHQSTQSSLPSEENHR